MKTYNKKRFYKKKWFLFFLVLCIICVFLQFFLQFRTSDKQTLKIFKKARVPVSIKYFNVKATNCSIRAIETSEKKKNTVLFVHGAPGSADAFYNYLKDPTLLKNAEIVTFDRPGYGYSDFGKAHPSIIKQAMAVSELIDSLHLKNVILVGHSYGAPVAAYATLKNKDIKGLVMLSPAIAPDKEIYFWVGNLARWRATRWLVPPAFVVSADEKYTHEAALRLIEPQWKNLQVPTVIIHGKKDMLASYENMTYAKEQFKNAPVRTISLPEENHFIPWTKQQLIVREIDSLIHL
ncbi:alpha/beta hydrolase [Galbibacter sp. PAP.153]|uniref:alpha/beta fold hydrolase n=1 Tax=Galbibacter sp. PAP.153 TaxID=3104623 RepID=UPI00300978BF